jgi:hypothetical protein
VPYMAHQYSGKLKWWLAGAYLALVIGSALSAGSVDHAGVVVYRLALPLSVFSFGAQPNALGWLVLGLATSANAGLLYAIGAALASRFSARAA